jgi:hypothetical protein
MHTFQANEAKIEANFEDYAFTIRAALSLYQNTGNIAYLEQGERLTKIAIENFETTQNPFFTYTQNPVMFSEIISIDDNVIPSANSIMAENLWMLGHLLENKNYSTKAKKMLDGVFSYFDKGKGSDYTQWASLISKVAYSYKEVVIVGSEAQKN